jgi:hypothetical protein
MTEATRQPVTKESTSWSLGLARRLRWGVARLLVVGLALIVGCLLIEGLCRGYLWLHPPTGHVGRWTFRGTCPAPYQGADYFSRDFLIESMHAEGGVPQPGTGYMVAKEFTGHYINAHDQRRRTTDQPANPDGRVLLFGGSTVFCAEVPDEWTIASCLQRLLNQRPGPRLLVENYGTCTMLARQQTERLQTTPIQAGDTVIFYDGVNDVYYPIYNGNVRGWHPGDGHDGGIRRLSRLQRHLYPLCFRTRDVSATSRVLLERMDARPPNNVANPKTEAANLDAAGLAYHKTLLEAHHLVTNEQAHFVHFLQPTIFSLTHKTTYERQVIQNELKALPGIDEAFDIGYPRLRAVLDAAGQEGLVSFDLSEVLRDRPAGQEFYLDFCHVNHLANERIAQEIFDHAFALPSSSH